MQITANTTPLITASTLVTTTKDVATPELPDTISPTTPDVLVNFSGPKATPDTYEQPKLVNVVQIHNTQTKGIAAANINQALTTELSSLSSNKSPFTTRDFFSQIGALSRETSQYKNDARSQQMASTKATDKLKLDFDDYVGKPNETVTLQVRTKDGDKIDIKIQHSQGTLGDKLEFSFNVDGKLSKEEQDALEKLTNKLGDVADDFFRTGTTQLHGLKEFDQAQLKDFHIEFSKAKSANAYTTMSYDYSVDEKSQHLSAKDGDGYSLDITTDLKNLLDAANPFSNQALENYLSIVRKTMNEHQPLQEEHSNSPSLRFIIDGLSSMLAPQKNLNDSPATSPAEKALTAFDTGLPDFTAVINAPLLMLYKPENQLTLPESMSLRLEQHTQTEKNDQGGLLVKQVNSFERQSREIEGVVGTDKRDLTRGNFTYKTIHEKQQMSRILNVAETGVNNMTSEFTSSMETKLETYKGFHLTDVKTDEHQDRKLTQLNDEISNHKDVTQLLNSLGYLEQSKSALFF